MRTVNEAATAYTNAHCFPKNKDDFRRQMHRAYTRGVWFAQRWISVDEELPPVSDEDILIKGIDYRGVEGIVDIGYMHGPGTGKENIISLSCEVETVTHWRPIELK
jgi:hypothetical protein